MRNGAVDVRQARHARARRGGPDDGHGLLARRPPDRRRRCRTRAARQTLLFSATMPEEVMKLADEVVRDARYVQVGSAGGPARGITHAIENVAGRAEDRVAGEVPAPDRRPGPGVRADQVRRRAAGAASCRGWAQGGGAARRPHAAAADAGGRRLPQRALSRARRDRRRGARPRHRRHHARRELRSARRTAKPTSIASAGPAGRTPPAPRSRSSRPRSCARSRRCSDRSGSSCRD